MREPEAVSPCGDQTRLREPRKSPPAQRPTSWQSLVAAVFSSCAVACRGIPLGLRVLGSGVFFFGAVAARAQVPAIIHDSGQGVPIAPMLAQAMAHEDGTVANPVQWPLRQQVLRPGRLSQDRQWPEAEWLSQPIFIVGSDARSLRWLRDNGETLRQLGASGLLVAGRGERDLQAARQAASGLVINAAPVPWLASRLQTLNAAVLPLLITADGRITQQVRARP